MGSSMTECATLYKSLDLLLMAGKVGNLIDSLLHQFGRESDAGECGVQLWHSFT